MFEYDSKAHFTWCLIVTHRNRIELGINRNCIFLIFLHGLLIFCVKKDSTWTSERAFHVFHRGTNHHSSHNLCSLGNAQISMWYWYLTITMNMWWWPQNDQLMLLKCLITSGTSVVVYVSQMKENHVIPIWKYPIKHTAL